MNKDVHILAIESSCDETSVAVVKNGREVLSNTISSQIEIHRDYGGVVPEIASRNHIQNINIVIEESLVESKKTLDEMDAIGVAYGPGLVGALLVGTSTAKAIAFAKKKPLIPVNHIEGHIYANFIEYPNIEPPFTCLIASGGHTQIVNMLDYGKYEVIGSTRDDAAGEAFDKVARVLGLEYPGGPEIDKLSKIGDSNSIDFPKVKIKDSEFDFSFSGLKSAVLNYINKEKQNRKNLNIENIAASFQKRVIEELVVKTIKVAKQSNMKVIAVAGGVAANDSLRKELKKEGKENSIDIYFPSKILCTDNAAMIGSVAYYNYIRGIVGDMKLNPVSNLKL